MSEIIISALIAAMLGVISSAITLYIGTRTMRIDREKIKIEREQLQAEIRQAARQALVWEAEANKLKAEANKIETEVKEIRQKHIEAERHEIQSLLLPFERAIFYPRMANADPVEIFRGIRQTRLTLQMQGAALFRDYEIAKNFEYIQEILLEAESDVKKRFPKISELANSMEDLPRGQQRQEVGNILETDFGASRNLMCKYLRETMPYLKEIREKLELLDVFHFR